MKSVDLFFQLVEKRAGQLQNTALSFPTKPQLWLVQRFNLQVLVGPYAVIFAAYNANPGLITQPSPQKVKMTL